MCIHLRTMNILPPLCAADGFSFLWYRPLASDRIFQSQCESSINNIIHNLMDWTSKPALILNRFSVCSWYGVAYSNIISMGHADTVLRLQYEAVLSLFPYFHQLILIDSFLKSLFVMVEMNFTTIQMNKEIILR